MIQAIGLTSLPRRHQLTPAVDDLTFEARPGRVTVLLGTEGSGKTTALRLMLQLQAGRGTALFRGRAVHRIQHLAREVGVLLGEVNGHPGRTARSHLRMLSAAAGVPQSRADDVLDVVGLSGLADQRMSTYSRGMDRRLGMACALLGDPHTLVLDEPAHGLSPRETAWLYSLLRGFAHQGGTVLVTSHTSDEAAELGDRVVSIDSGRLVADQHIADFVRTRLRPRVAVRTPHVDRLVAVVTQEARKAGKDRGNGPIKVVREGGTKVSVYGSSCAEVGELAHRNGILVHQLTDERGVMGDTYAPGPLERADGRRSSGEAAAPDSQPAAPSSDADGTEVTEARPGTTAAAGSGKGSDSVTPTLEEELEEIDDTPGEHAAGSSDAAASVGRAASGSSDPARGGSPESRSADVSSVPKASSASSEPHRGVSRAAVDRDSLSDAYSEAEDEFRSEGPSEHEPVLVTASAASPTRFAYGSASSVRAVTSNARSVVAESEHAEPVFREEESATAADSQGGPATDDGAGPATSRTDDADPTSAEAPTLQLSESPLADPTVSGTDTTADTSAVAETDDADADDSTGDSGEVLDASGVSDSFTPDPKAPESPADADADADAGTDSDAGTVSDPPDLAPNLDSAETNGSSAVPDPAAGTGGEAPAAPRPVLMKLLLDPDGSRKSKPLWTPKRPPVRAAAELPPQLHAFARPGPAAPLRYEVCRLASVRSTWIAVAVTVVVALCISLVMARTGLGVPSGADNSLTPVVRLLTGWPSGDLYVVPPVAVAAGLLGAFAFGEEFRYPALAPARSPVPRRISLLAAKLAVSAALTVLLGITVAAVNAAGVTLFFGAEALSLPTDATSAADGPWQLHVMGVFVLAIGCAWAGVLAAGVFRSGTVGTAVVVAVPLLLAPLVRTFLGDARHTTDGLPGRLETVLLMPWPPGTERWVAALIELASQPVGFALALTVAALLTGYVVSALNSRAG